MHLTECLYLLYCSGSHCAVCPALGASVAGMARGARGIAHSAWLLKHRSSDIAHRPQHAGGVVLRLTLETQTATGSWL